MDVLLIATDLAETVAEKRLTGGQIHSVFDHAVNCTFGECGWLTLLTEEAAIGPMSAVLKAEALTSLPLVPGMLMEIGHGRLVIAEAGLTLQLKGAVHWNPRPEPLREPVSLLLMRDRLDTLENWIRKSANPAGIANVLDYLELPGRGRKQIPDMALNAFGQFALDRIQAFASVMADTEPDRLRERIRGIIGFGPGLTPSGDDFLAGVGASMLYLREFYGFKATAFDLVLRLIAEEARGRTTRVSEEMLKNLARGLMPKRFMDLQTALLSQGSPELGQALRELGRMGETSGADHGLGAYVAHAVLASDDVRRKLG